MNPRLIVVWSLTAAAYLAWGALAMGMLLWLPHQILAPTAQDGFTAGWFVVMTSLNVSDGLRQLIYRKPQTVSRGWRLVSFALIAGFLTMFVVNSYQEGWRVTAAGGLAGFGAGVTVFVLVALINAFHRRLQAWVRVSSPLLLAT